MNFAIVENGKVTDVIVADSEDVAKALFPKADVIAVTEQTKGAFIGGSWLAGSKKFAAPQPFVSWTLDEATGEWEAPVAYPSDGKGYTWDEDSKSWKELPAPPAE